MLDTLLYAGLANAVGATVLAVGVALFCRLLRRPAWRHALWLLVLLKLIPPPLLPLPLPWPETSPAATPVSSAEPLPAPPVTLAVLELPDGAANEAPTSSDIPLSAEDNPTP